MKSEITRDPAFRMTLRGAYFSREKGVEGNDWPLKVMRRVREIGPIALSGFWPDFERLVWRLAPVSGILVVALAILLLSMGSQFGYDYLGTVTADLEQPTMGELFGLGG